MTPREQHTLTCRDCPAPYGEDGWCDVSIPDATWNFICPEGGVLCFRCMTKRIEAHGLRDVPVIVSSGPYRDANEEWRMHGWNHGYKVGKAESNTSADIYPSAAGMGAPATTADSTHVAEISAPQLITLGTKLPRPREQHTQESK